MFDHFTRSWELAKASGSVLYNDKKLILFPIFSGIGTLIVVISFVAPILGLQMAGKINLAPEGGNVQIPWWTYLVLFAFYFCTYFVIIFCNAALVSCALLRFSGEEASLGDGFAAAARRLPQILAWAFVSATVGLLLKAIENAHEKVGQIISAILGTAWTVVTFFVIPVLVVEKTGPIEAIRRSTSILRKTWGEALVGNFGLGLLKFLFTLPGILLLFGGIYLMSALNTVVPGAIVMGAGVLVLLLASAIGSALSTIFLTALYQYAAFDQVPAGFDRRTLQEAFVPRKAA